MQSRSIRRFRRFWWWSG